VDVAEEESGLGNQTIGWAKQPKTRYSIFLFFIGNSNYKYPFFLDFTWENLTPFLPKGYHHTFWGGAVEVFMPTGLGPNWRPRILIRVLWNLGNMSHATRS